ncbi:MAG: FitA-like ribbon-helix-helix domain-containing protein [Planctomycetia bacterium]
MPSITLKDVPESLLARLRAAATRERRSLNQEALVLIEGGLAAAETAEERAARQVSAWRALAGGWATEATFEDEVAALYAARTTGRTVDL